MNGEFTAGPWGLKTANGFCFNPTRRNRSDGGPCAENWAFVCHYGNWFLCVCFLFPWDWSSNENFNGFVWGRPGFAQPVCLWVHLIVISQLDAPWSIAVSRGIRRN